jgi:hypothetical protein
MEIRDKERKKHALDDGRKDRKCRDDMAYAKKIVPWGELAKS